MHPTQDRTWLLRKARIDASRLLRYRPRSIEELAGRLRLRKFPADVIQTVIAELTRAGELNDRQFAVLWARSRARGFRGSPLIARELSEHGVARPVIAETLAALQREYDEREAAREFVEGRRARYRREPLFVQRRRLSQQLARRGFTMEIIEDVMQQCLRDNASCQC